MRLRPTRTAVTMVATAAVGGLLVAGPAAAARLGLQAPQDPTVTISDSKVRPGDTVRFTVKDCLGSDSDSFARWVDSSGDRHSVDMPKGQEQFSRSFSVPKGTPDGKATLTVKCYGRASASFTVSSPSRDDNDNDNKPRPTTKPRPNTKPSSPTRHRGYPLKGKWSREAGPARAVSSAPRYTG